MKISESNNRQAAIRDYRVNFIAERVRQSEVDFDTIWHELNCLGKTISKKSVQHYISLLKKREVVHVVRHIKSKTQITEAGKYCFIQVLAYGPGENAVAPRSYDDVLRLTIGDTDRNDHPLNYFYQSAKRYLKDFEHPYYRAANHG